jgi:hypothetical protein
MSVIRLPVSEAVVELRPPTGADDMQLLEMTGDPLEVSMAWLDRLARRADGSPLDAGTLPLTDVEWLLLEHRRMLLGDQVVARSRCFDAKCGASADLSFLITEYLAHHQPRRSRKTECADSPGWFRLRGSGVMFRPPIAADVVAARRSRHPEKELERQSLRGEGATAAERRRAQRALEALSPSLSAEVEGRCPECGTTARFWFDVHSYVQRELRYEAELLYEDVNLLAGRYHWPEEKILALPRSRRLQYAELALRGAN